MNAEKKQKMRQRFTDRTKEKRSVDEKKEGEDGIRNALVSKPSGLVRSLT
jgi:hypothetical protein